MARYLLGRLFGIVIVLFIVSIVIFLLMHAIPGGPFDEDKMPLSASSQGQLPAQIRAGQAAGPSSIVMLHGQALHGDFRDSLSEPDRDGHRVDRAHVAGEQHRSGNGDHCWWRCRWAFCWGCWRRRTRTPGSTMPPPLRPRSGLTVPNFVIADLAAAALCRTVARAADGRLGPVVSLHHAGHRAGRWRRWH